MLMITFSVLCAITEPKLICLKKTVKTVHVTFLKRRDGQIFYKQDQSPICDSGKGVFCVLYLCWRDENPSSVKIGGQVFVAFSPLHPSVIWCKCEEQQPVLTSVPPPSHFFSHLV